MAFPQLDLSFDQVKDIFNEIDTDGSGSIDKEEMGQFLTALMMLQRDLDFKSTNAFHHQS